ncbi:MAG TPA: site-specific integrase [Terriglobales bacterium]
MKRQDGYLTKESGAWLGHYSRWITDHGTGARKRQQRAFKIGQVAALKKTQARDKLRERIVSESGVTADSRLTVAGFIENRWKPLKEGGWRDSTKAVNAEHLKYIVYRFGKTPVEEMDNVAMQSWLTELATTKSGSLVRHCFIFLRSIMSEATEQEYCRKNPARLLRLPKLKAVKKDFLSLEQIKALFKAAKWQPRDRTLLTVILVTALRPSELFALRWKCLDFAKDSATVTLHETVYRGVLRPYTKTTEEGEMPRLVVPEQAVIALLEWLQQTKHSGPEDFIFPNADGGFLLKENYSKRVLKDLAERADCKPKIARLNFQVLRRTVATHAQHLGSLKDVQTIMRHKQAETTQRIYIQAIDTTVRAASELLAGKMLKK